MKSLVFIHIIKTVILSRPPLNSRVPIGSTRIQSVCQEEKKGISSSADKKDTEIRNHGKQIPDSIYIYKGYKCWIWTIEISELAEKQEWRLGQKGERRARTRKTSTPFRILGNKQYFPILNWTEQSTETRIRTGIPFSEFKSPPGLGLRSSLFNLSSAEAKPVAKRSKFQSENKYFESRNDIA